MVIAGQKMKHQACGITVKQLVDHFGYCRSAYYKACVAKRKQENQNELVLQWVRKERKLQSKLGCEKIYELIKPELIQAGIKMGRDKLYNLMRDNGLLIKRRKWRGPRTTDSRHNFKRYGNLIKNRVISAPNQVWVCDITYLRVGSSWMYLCLVMDAYSRKIVGWQLHDSLEMVGCMKALKMAIRSLPRGFNHTQLVHHSDHGIQYCCKAYRGLLNNKGIKISMAAIGDCYENAQAERLNGIMKQEYGLGDWLPNKSKARLAVKQGVNLYNTRRPHRALGLAFPKQVHEGAAANVRMGWTKKVA